MADPPERPRYLRAAFTNAYNIVAIAGMTAAGLATGHTWMLAAGVALEAVWLAAGPRLGLVRRSVDLQLASGRRLARANELQKEAARLPGDLRRRVQDFLLRANDVRTELSRRDPGGHLVEELLQLDDLVADYVGLSLTAFRAQSHVAKAEVQKICDERDAHAALATSAPDEETRALARQNRDVLARRLATFDELGRYVTRARAQLSLIENTVLLLRDQAVTLATPDVVARPLDGLVESVEAMRVATRDAEALVAAGEAGAPATAALPSGARTRD